MAEITAFPRASNHGVGKEAKDDEPEGDFPASIEHADPRTRWRKMETGLDRAKDQIEQTFVPPGRTLDPGVFEVGIDLREHARGKGYGREAIAVFTDWLFDQEAAKYGVLPLDNRAFSRAITPRPSATAGKTVFTYTGVNVGIPDGNAPSILNR